MRDHDLVEFLPWDSEFFGRRIAKIKPNDFDAAAGRRVLEWCARERIECLYFLADPSAAEAMAWVQEAGFRVMDIRATLRIDVRAAGSAGNFGVEAANVAPCQPGDLAALRRIARVSHRDSRFYADPSLRGAAGDLFETWIRKSCEGYADAVFVAERDGAPAGYITLHYSSPSDSRIGLFAVDPQARGRGIGRRLIGRGLEWLCAQGASESRVVTQGRNRGALRLYQNAGFRVESLQLWYHLWLNRPQIP